VGVGGVVIDKGRVLLARRGSPPLENQWSIPGGALELGETLAQAVVRELKEETGLDVNVLELIEVFERLDPAPPGEGASPGGGSRPRYHYVILDYLCGARGGSLHAGSDALDLVWAREDELGKFGLTEVALRVLRRAFALARSRTA
jgi:8-oxo-dGTP diphosphatase